jgi:hypothetical protein
VVLAPDVPEGRRVGSLGRAPGATSVGCSDGRRALDQVDNLRGFLYSTGRRVLDCVGSLGGFVYKGPSCDVDSGSCLLLDHPDGISLYSPVLLRLLGDSTIRLAHCAVPASRGTFKRGLSSERSCCSSTSLFLRRIVKGLISASPRLCETSVGCRCGRRLLYLDRPDGVSSSSAVLFRLLGDCTICLVGRSVCDGLYQD